MARIPVILALALGLVHVSQSVFVNSPRHLFLQQAGFHLPQPTDFGQLLAAPFPARQNVAGLGPASDSPAQSSAATTSFSNPPPPLGSALDPATRSCGLAPTVCSDSRYRSIDGSCNNLLRPTWGVPQTAYGRLAPYNYGDGVQAFPVSKSGNQLPNPRTISRLLFDDRQLVDPVWNLNAMQWGQIITHDMSLTAGVTQSPAIKHKEPVTCCDDNGRITADASTNPQCAPILVPPHDSTHGPQGTQCFNFVRTGSTRDRGCTPPNAPAEPISVVTAYMDLSLVYGSSPGQAAPLRAGASGRLLTRRSNGQEWPPQDPNITQTCESAQSPNEPCYLTGDIRVNQNPQLTLLQVVLLREHNRIADSLAKLNPHWSDEIIFQEARRINIAQIQRINYYEWLPIFLGWENMVKNRIIYPGIKGYVNDYNPSVNPAILDEHATAAFRHFHTLIRGYLHMVSESRELVSAIRLSDWFNRPLILELENGFNNLARGLTEQNEDFSDQFWDSEITQFLFKRNNTFGGDLRATDIQRGRDHGLPTYSTTRTVCGLPTPRTFEDMTDFISAENVKVLKSLYESPDDVELVVAGSLERLVPGALAGPTYLCILTEQFYRTRVGDRYFYENGGTTTAFTPSQLESIRQATMARLLCDNVDDIRVMQPQAFRLVGEGNKLVSCDQLPFVDLTLWQDASAHFK